MGAAGNLDNPHALKAFISKFPDSCHERYFILKNTPGMEGKRASEIVNNFMVEEREFQSQLKSYTRVTADMSKVGHPVRDIRSLGKKRIDNMRSGDPSFPACKQTHTFTWRKDGTNRTLNSTRFGDCYLFLNKSPEERAKLIKKYNGCA